MLIVIGLEVQLVSDVATIVNIVVCGELVAFVKLPEMVAEFPLAEIPVRLVVLSRVHV